MAAAAEEPGRLLRLSDREWISARLSAASGAPAEYEFANLFLFRARHAYRLVDGPIPHLRGMTYDGQRHALPLAPLDRASADNLLDTNDCLFPLGREALELAATLGLACGFSAEDSDYVFDAARLAGLHGAKTRRAQARAFAATRAPTAHTVTRALADEMMRVLEGWFADVDRDADATDLAECRDAIGNLAALGLRGALVRTGEDEPVAFLLASARTDGEHVIHFAKGRRAHDGAYPWLFARYAAASGAKRLNFEQDLGNPGFAQSKRSYAPAELRAKYRLTRP
jgi:hypothetical protein